MLVEGLSAETSEFVMLTLSLRSRFCLYFVPWKDHPRGSFAYPFEGLRPGAVGAIDVYAKEPLGWSFHGTKYGQKHERKLKVNITNSLVSADRPFTNNLINYLVSTFVFYSKTFIKQNTVFHVSNSIHYDLFPKEL